MPVPVGPSTEMDREVELAPSVNEPNDRVTLVYLLNLWQETATSSWRASLRAAGEEPRIPFADLEALARYLLEVPEHLGRSAGTIEAGDDITRVHDRGEKHRDMDVERG